MRKKIYLIFMMVGLLLCSGFCLTSCGPTGGKGGGEGTLSSITAEVSDSAYFDYQYDEGSKTFTFPAGSNVRSIVSQSLFKVQSHFSNGKTQRVQNFEVTLLDGAEGHDYTIRIAYENLHLDFYVNLQVQYLLVSPKLLPKEGFDGTFVYVKGAFEYSGQEINMLSLITQGEQTLRNYIEQGLASIESGTTTATSANPASNPTNSFVVKAAPGYKWTYGTQKYDAITVEWKIEPKQIDIKIPALESYSLEFKPSTTGSGEKQYLNFTFYDGQEKYFDFSQEFVDSEAKSEVGDSYVWEIYLKEEYRSASARNNYKFVYEGVTETNRSNYVLGRIYNATLVSNTVRLEVKWEITPKILPISSIEIVNIDDTNYSTYYTTIDGTPRFRHNADSIRPAVNYMQYQLGYLFNSSVLDNDSSLGLHTFDVTVNQTVAGSYRFADGSALPTGNIQLSYYIDGSVYELPETFDKDHVALHDTIFPDSFEIADVMSALNRAFAPNGSSFLGAQEPTIYCFESQFPEQMLLSNYILSLANDDQVLEIGENEIGIYFYYNEYYEPILLSCTLNLAPKQVLCKIEWELFSQNYPTYDGQGKQNNAQVSILQQDNMSVTHEESYEVFYSADGVEEYGLVASTQANNLATACINAGYYKTVLSVDCQDGYYLYTANNANSAKDNVFVVEYLWQIEKQPVEVFGTFEGLNSYNQNYFLIYDDTEPNQQEPVSPISYNLHNFSVGIDEENPIQSIKTFMIFGDNVFEMDYPREIGEYRTEVVFNTLPNYSAKTQTINWQIVGREYDLSSINWDLELRVASSSRTLAYGYVGDTSILPKLDLPIGYSAMYTYYSVGGNNQLTQVAAPSELGNYVVKTEINVLDAISQNPDCTVTGSSNVADLYFSIVKRTLTSQDFEWDYNGELYAPTSSYGLSHQVSIHPIYPYLSDCVNIVISGDRYVSEAGNYTTTATITINPNYSSKIALAEYNENTQSYQLSSQIVITLDWAVLPAGNQS